MTQEPVAPRRKRVLLVCAWRHLELENLLESAGCAVLKAANGSDALFRARHEKLDGIILVSVTSDMDLTETALNLRDIDPDLRIIVIAEGNGRREETIQVASIVRAIPGARILSKDELNTYLTSPEWNSTKTP